MTFTPERTTITQKVQVGPESTSALGTPVAAGKLLECFDWTVGIVPDVSFYTPTGHKYSTEQEENMEWVEGSIGGNLDYNGLVYLLGGAMGAASAVSHLSSVTAKDWVYTPTTSSVIVPQTLTVQQGDASRAHQFAYGLITEFGYHVDRKATTVSSKILGQPLSDGATLTSNPTAVAMAPIVGKQVNLYLDSTSVGLGTTLLNRALSFDYSFTSIYGPLWVLNRATVGFTSHVDLKPTCTIKLKVEANAEGMALLGYLQSGTTYFLRVAAQGAQIASDGPGAVFNGFTHDMAIKFGKPSPFADEQGVYAIEWEANVVEDPTWGKAQTCTATNLIAAL